MITALLLAAGSARRFGAPKLLEDLGGRPLVRRAAEALLAAGVESVVAVVPPEHGALERALDGTGARCIANVRADHGIGASIAAGVASLDDRCRAALIVLGDEPALDPAVIARVIDAYRRSRTRPAPAIVATRYRGVPGHPVLFDRSVFAELRALDGDHGARSVIDRDPTRVHVIDVDTPPPGDVDTPTDLARARRERQNMSGPSTSPSRDT